MSRVHVVDMKHLTCYRMQQINRPNTVEHTKHDLKICLVNNECRVFDTPHRQSTSCSRREIQSVAQTCVKYSKKRPPCNNVGSLPTFFNVTITRFVHCTTFVTFLRQPFFLILHNMQCWSKQHKKLTVHVPIRITSLLFHTTVQLLDMLHASILNRSDHTRNAPSRTYHNYINSFHTFNCMKHESMIAEQQR